MFRNYLAAALRNLVRNRLYAAINIVGLAVGFAAALLIALFVREELSYDRWIPGHARTYLLTTTDKAALNFDIFPAELAPRLELAVPAVKAVARLVAEDVGLRHGDVEGNEHIYWADPAVFDVLPLPAFAGDLKTALDRPDSIVLTRAFARKYFGRDEAVGETLEINRQHPMTVTAVLEDLPSNTHLDTAIVASGRAPASALNKPNAADIAAFTYARLKPGTTTAVFQQTLKDFGGLQRPDIMTLPSGKHAVFVPVPIAEVHFGPPSSFNVFIMKPRGSKTVVVSVSIIGLLILLVASINFVNLMTASAARRATEVGVRKVSGAERRDLIVQFIGEALLYVLFSAAAGVAAAQLLSSKLQTFLGRTTAVQYWHNPVFLVGILGFVAVLGILAGAYPAFVLSAFRPAGALKASVTRGSGSARLRRILATVQFAVLIGLILATGTIYNQLHFALNQGLRIDTDQTLLITTACKAPLRDHVRALPGVRAAVCSHARALTVGGQIGRTDLPDGSQVLLHFTSVGPGFFEFYGLRPLAGRFLAEDRGDEKPFAPDAAPPAPPAVVINETALHKFGFPSAAAAVGQLLPMGRGPNGVMKAEVVGVVPDFQLDSISTAVAPMFFYSDPDAYGVLNVKLSGRNIPETLAAIDGLWRDFGEPRAIIRTFVDQRLEDLYKDIVHQGQVFGAFAAVAVFIACLGLFGLAAFTAESRTKEIGVRKAMGASRTDVLRLLLWEFAKPVVWANAVAWPIGYFVMRRWLQGFAYHAPLEPWTFLAASAIALVIAVLTVAGHVALITRTQPASALRYE